MNVMVLDADFYRPVFGTVDRITAKKQIINLVLLAAWKLANI